MPRLVVEKGPDKGKYLSISGKDTIIIGRETTASIRLADLMVSRLHFRIELRADGYYLIDLNSMNGTFVNGQMVKEKLLKIGDKVQIGETLFSFLGDVEAQKQGPIGQTIGGYKIMERVGRGGMGTVYKAMQLSLNRIVALKLLSDELVKDKTFIKLFVQEAQAAAQLNNPNIVQVYDVGDVNKETYYFSMEYVPGGSVQDVILRRKKLPPEIALNIILQAARGLEYAEKKGIVHRDIKPDNLMIGEDDAIKIGDLGLATSLNKPFEEEQTSSMFGTPHYVAPEQALGKPVDHRADIYSLGATFYRILTGITPYSGSSVKEIITKKIKEDPAPLKQLEPGLSNELCNLVDKMIKRAPEERFQTVSELVSALEKIKSGGIPVREAITEAPETTLEPVTKIRKKDFVVAFVLPTVLFILSGMSIFLIIWHYYFNIRPLFAGTEKPPVVSPEEEKQALQEWGKAEEFLKSITPQDFVAIGEALKQYETILKKYPSVSIVPKVKSRIDELNRRLSQLDAPTRLKYLEIVAGKEVAGLLKEEAEEYQSLIEYTKITEVPTFFKKWIARLIEFKIKYKGVPSVSKAEDEIKRLQLLRQRFEYAEQEYRRIEREAEDALSEHRFNDAYKSLDTFLKDEAYQNMLYDRLADNLLKKVKDEAKASFQIQWEKISSLVKQENLYEARDLTIKIQGGYGVPEIERQLADILADIKKKIKEKEDAELKRLLESDRQTFYPLYIEALTILQQGDFKDYARLLLSEDNIKVHTDDYRSRVESVRYEIACEQGIISNTIKARAPMIIKSKGVKFRDKAVKEISESGIRTTDDRIAPWSEVTAIEIFYLVDNNWKLSSLENLKLGVLCLKRGGLTKQAKKLFNQIAPSDLNREEQAILNHYLNNLTNESGLREIDAELILQHALDSDMAGQNYNALKSYNLLKSRFSDTALYKKEKNAIEDRIKQIQNKIK